MFIHFEKNNILNKKIIVFFIWIFSLIAIVFLAVILYQELVLERLINVDSMVNLETLFGVGIGIILISGLLLESKVARWIILLLAYISFLSPFIMFITILIFAPESNESLGSMIILPNLIMSFSIIYLLSNKISLRLYKIKIKSKVKSRIKEQVYLFIISVILIGLYTYYIHIPLLSTSESELQNLSTALIF